MPLLDETEHETLVDNNLEIFNTLKAAKVKKDILSKSIPSELFVPTLITLFLTPYFMPILKRQQNICT